MATDKEQAEVLKKMLQTQEKTNSLLLGLAGISVLGRAKKAITNRRSESTPGAFNLRDRTLLPTFSDASRTQAFTEKLKEQREQMPISASARGIGNIFRRDIGTLMPAVGESFAGRRRGLLGTAAFGAKLPLDLALKGFQKLSGRRGRDGEESDLTTPADSVVPNGDQKIADDVEVTQQQATQQTIHLEKLEEYNLRSALALEEMLKHLQTQAEEAKNAANLAKVEASERDRMLQEVAESVGGAATAASDSGGGGGDVNVDTGGLVAGVAGGLVTGLGLALTKTKALLAATGKGIAATVAGGTKLAGAAAAGIGGAAAGAAKLGAMSVGTAFASAPLAVAGMIAAAGAIGGAAGYGLNKLGSAIFGEDEFNDVLLLGGLLGTTTAEAQAGKAADTEFNASSARISADTSDPMTTAKMAMRTARLPLMQGDSEKALRFAASDPEFVAANKDGLYASLKKLNNQNKKAGLKAIPDATLREFAEGARELEPVDSPQASSQLSSAGEMVATAGEKISAASRSMQGRGGNAMSKAKIDALHKLPPEAVSSGNYELSYDTSDFESSGVVTANLIPKQTASSGNAVEPRMSEGGGSTNVVNAPSVTNVTQSAPPSTPQSSRPTRPDPSVEAFQGV